MNQKTETKEVNTLEFLYKEAQIHFLVNPDDDNVLINATEMGNLFGKLAKDYLKTVQTEKFIEACCSDENFNEIFGFGTVLTDSENEFGEDNNPSQNIILSFEERKNHLVIVKSGGRNNGTWLHEIIALDFAAWLDVNFRFWVFNTIRKITFGYLKEYRDAMQEEVLLKSKTATLKQNLILNPSIENVEAFFNNEAKIITAKNRKRVAQTNQLNLFKDFFKQ